jgi:hypothetical protein
MGDYISMALAVTVVVACLALPDEGGPTKHA